MLALTGARLLDGTGAEPVDDVTVVVDGGRIVGLEPGSSKAALDRGVEVVDVAGATVMPGLIDVHVHMSTPEPLTEQGRRDLTAVTAGFLARGITTVRDLGSYGSSLFELRSAIARGEVPGPRLVLSGQVISARTPGATSFPGMYRQCSGTDELRAAVRGQVARGADVVKVMVTGALTVAGEDVGPCQLTADELAAVVDEAARCCVPVAAHAEGADGIRAAVRAGVDTIEHGELAHTVPDVLAEMAERGIVLVPTLCVFGAVGHDFGDRFPTWVQQRALRLGEEARLTVAAAHAAGVSIAAGADAPPHGHNARELALLHEAGLPAMQAIMAATSVAARVCRLDGEVGATGVGTTGVGTVEVGKRADLLVVAGDPLTDLSILADPARLRHVLQEGVLVPRERQVSAGSGSVVDR